MRLDSRRVAVACALALSALIQGCGPGDDGFFEDGETAIESLSAANAHGPRMYIVRFNDGVDDIKDLQPGMELEGTVSNVAAFGAFVDLGVHQDGLVHVSQLSHKFVTDAREVVKTGDIVKVKVLEVDAARKRISLTMKLGGPVARPGAPRENRCEGAGRGQRAPAPAPAPAAATVMAGAFAKLQGLRK